MFLPQRVVDARSCRRPRIDLRQQRGRHLHEGHAAHVAGRRKAGHVADHAAAQREQHGLAVAAVRPAARRRCRFSVAQSLCASPSGSSSTCTLGHGGLQRLAAARPHTAARRCVLVTISGRGGARQARATRRVVQQAAADQDVVAALAELDLDACACRGRLAWRRVYALRRVLRRRRGDAGCGSTMPASSSCIRIMFTSVGTEGRPVSITKCAVSAVQRVALAVQLAQPAPAGRRTCSSGRVRVVAQAPEQLLRRGAQVDHRGALVQRRGSASRSTAPPPVASTRAPACGQSVDDLPARRRGNAGFACASKKSRIEQPIARSISWSLSTKGKPR